jgi:PPM family protein phosphatase
MICPKCGVEVNEEDNFCEECGGSLKKKTTISNITGNNTPPYSNATFTNFPKSEITVCDSNLASVTNMGRKHSPNEDAGTVVKAENGNSILIVADGVSSSVNATTGSRKAIEIIKEVLVKNDEPAKEAIISSIRLANNAIKELPYESREDGLYGPETTIVTALVKGDTATIGWVGDSRAYVLSNDKQEKLTVDDSWAEMVVAEGSMTMEEAMADKMAHCVTQVLGMHDQQAKAHLLECKLKEGEILLLCSDGLWNYFQGDKALLNAVTAFGINSEAGHICEHLVGLANAAGGHDNITVAIYRSK